METATEKDTRLFRFGAVVPEEHQDLALRLAALEDRLNGEVTLIENAEGTQHIYFVVTITDEVSQPAENTVLEENGEIFIRVSCEGDFGVVQDQLVAAFQATGNFSNEIMSHLEKLLLQS